MQIKFSNPYQDKLDEHIKYAASLGLKVIKPNTHTGKTAIIVGSGPSLSDDPQVIEKIRELFDNGAYIFACKAAIKYLYDRGITPQFAVSMDPGDHIATPEKMFKAPGTTHIIASSSNPATFNYLLNDDEFGKAEVKIFHSACGHPDEVKLYKKLFKSAFAIGGGFNVVNRAISVAQFLNFETIYLAGADCGWRDGQDFYCDKSQTKYKKIPMNDSGLVDGKLWYTAPDMLASAVAIAKIAKEHKDKFFFIGDILPRSLARHDDVGFLDQCANLG